MRPVPTTPDDAAPLLDSWGIEDFPRGFRNVQALAARVGVAWPALLEPLHRALPTSADPDLALNTLERFVATDDGLVLLPTLVGDAGRPLEMLVQLFGVSQFFGDVLVADPDFWETAIAPLRVTPTREELEQALWRVLDENTDDAHVLRAIRRFRRRQLLRIGVNDILRQRPLEEITADLSRVAEAAVAVGWEWACRKTSQRFGTPTTGDGAATAAVLAFGKLGGSELNYSSDIDLMIVYNAEGQTSGRRPIGNDEFYARAASELIRLLSSHTDRGSAYRVDFRLRPEGQHGPLARSLAGTLAYYDALGRTWERQALIKVRPIAGDAVLGQEFVDAIQPFVYKRFLSVAEINDIKAMKRKIEHKAQREGGTREVKTGRGGIRDIEFTIQFLQLLNGGDLSAVRHRDTLSAMQALASVGCLTDAEYRGLDDTYRFLRQVEHRLQLLFDLQQHRLPEDMHELRKLALRMGYTNPAEREPVAATLLKPSPSTLSAQRHSPLDEPSRVPTLDTRDLLVEPLDLFLHDYQEKTKLNRTVLEHLLTQTFTDSEKNVEPESDLILDPDPDSQTVQQVLEKHRFRDIPAAWRNLQQLAQEQRFLSTRRCRHFLANIAPLLLRAVGKTTDPDLALTNLEKVTASLGGKAVLWELFSYHPPSLQLYVDVCDSPFLAQMLINNPGMIDDLIDSLILNRPRRLEDLRSELTELLRGADKPEAVEPILHSFQDKEVLRIAVRDLLGKDDIRAVTAALSDVAEVLLDEVASRQETLLTERHGSACPHAIVAMGKLGGREMSYHSDLDLVVVYEAEGRTAGTRPIDHVEYFTEYARRLIKALSHMGPLGKLFAVDMRLRPTGKSGSLVISLDEFRRYYASTVAMVWERQALTRARTVHGSAPFAAAVNATIRDAMFHAGSAEHLRHEIRTMRQRLEATASPRSLKRGAGGMIDVEFLTQAMQLQHGSQRPAICCTNVWDGLDALRADGLISDQDHRLLSEGYSFYRRAEACLRIVTNRPLNEYPEAPAELEKLAQRMGERSGAALLARFADHATRIRESFQRLVPDS